MFSLSSSLTKKTSSRGPSDYRGGLWAATLEGLPAIVIIQLLGGPFLTGYLLYLGATSQQIGIVLAMTTIVNAAQIVMAIAMQHISNRKWTLLIFGGTHRLLWVSTGIIPYIAAKEWWVAVFIVMYTTAYLCNAAGAVVWTSLMGDIVPSRLRGKYTGRRNTLLWALAGLCIIVGGQILEAFPGGEGFRILFMICGVCAVLNIVAFAFYPNPPFEKSTERAVSGQIKRPFQDAVFRKAIIFLSVFILMQNIAVPFFSYVMLDVMQISYSHVSMYTLVMTLFMMAGYYVWGMLNARYPTQSLLLWTLPFIAGSCLIWSGLTVLPVWLVIGLAHICLGIGQGGFNLLAFNFIIGDTPKSERPMFIAVYSTLTGFAAFAGPILGGKLYDVAEQAPDWVQRYGISVIVGLLLVVCCYAGRFVFGLPDPYRYLKNRKMRWWNR
jgi:MFS family permease